MNSPIVVSIFCLLFLSNFPRLAHSEGVAVDFNDPFDSRDRDIRFFQFWQEFESQFGPDLEMSKFEDFVENARDFPYERLVDSLYLTFSELVDSYQTVLLEVGINHQSSKKIRGQLHSIMHALKYLADIQYFEKIRVRGQEFATFTENYRDSLKSIGLPTLADDILREFADMPDERKVLAPFPDWVDFKLITAHKRRSEEVKSMSVQEEVNYRLARSMKRIKDRYAGQEQLLGVVEKILRSLLLFEGQMLNLDITELAYPNALALIGSPGSGRETFVKALVDGIYGYDGAWADGHLYVLEPIQKEDGWNSHLGSATGYIGSDQRPRLVEFLADHSGGVYQVETISESSGKSKYVVVKSQEFPSGQSLSLSKPPVIYVKNPGAWSHSALSELANIMDGNVAIRNRAVNPETGMSGEDTVRVRPLVIFGSNAAERLYAGFAEPAKSLETLQGVAEARREIYNLHRDAKRKLRDLLAAGESDTIHKSGMPSDVLARIPDHGLILMEPYDPATVETVTAMLFGKVSELFLQSRADLEFSFQQSLVNFIAHYEQIPNQELSQLNNRISSIVVGTLNEAISQDTFAGIDGEIEVGIEQNLDKTRSLVYFSKGLEVGRTLILETQKDAPRPFISQEKIDRITKEFPARVNSQVLGVEHIVNKLVDAILVKENELATTKAGDPSRKGALVMFFTSLTSSGKTSLAKAMAWARYPQFSDPLLVENFAKIQSTGEIKEAFLGSMKGGKFEESLFIKKHRETNGHFVYTMDEITNSVVKFEHVAYALYDILREPSLTLANGEVLDMSNVTIVMTSNLGQHIYRDIPANLEPLLKQAAYERFHQLAYGSDAGVYEMARETLPTAFLARIGMENFHVFGPLNIQLVREILQVKLVDALKTLANPQLGRHWNVAFASHEDLIGFLDQMELNVYRIEEQGASLTRMGEQLGHQLTAELLKRGVPVGTEVLLETENLQETEIDATMLRTDVKLKATFIDTNGMPSSFTLIFEGISGRRPFKNEQDRMMITALHEAGHAIMRHALFHDLQTQTELSVLPGFGMVNGRPTLWGGIAVARNDRDLAYTQKMMLYGAAVKAGGHMAQVITSRGGVDDAGHGNDFWAVKDELRRGILHHGLAKNSYGLIIGDDLGDLSVDQRKALDRELEKMMKQVLHLTKFFLLANYDALWRLAHLLAEKGTLNQEEIKQFFDQQPIFSYDSDLKGRILARMSTWKPRTALARLLSALPPSPSSREAQIHAAVPKFPEPVDARELMQQNRREKLTHVKVHPEIPIASSNNHKSITASCEAVLLAGKEN